MPGLQSVGCGLTMTFAIQPGEFIQIQCFEGGEMKMFPVLRKQRVKKIAVKTTEEVPVYCKCRMPELPGEKLIECTNCKKWYHLDTCVNVPPTTCLDSSEP